MPLLTVPTLLPLPRFQPIFVRLVMSSTGAFGLVLSIALMARIAAWENVWDRLWITESLSWGTAQEKGLSAGFCLFLLAGTASDWFLKTRFGENPDQVRFQFRTSSNANFLLEMGPLSCRVRCKPSRCL